MTGRLNAKSAIVAGAGSVGPGWGNGRAISILFARERCKVFAVDVSSAALEDTVEQIEREGGEVEPYLCDVTDSSAVAGMAKACVKKYAQVDILVNNVGGSLPGGPVELSEELWHQQLDYNLTSTYLCCRYVLPLMRQRRSGSIVNVASASGMRFTGAAQVGYAAAKAGVIQFSKVVAVEYARYGVRVNTVIPGQLHTPMVEARLAGQRAGGDVAALLASRQKRIPLGFMGDGRDTAWAALFLASDEARFVTGAEIVVDGGMTVRCD